MMLGAAYWGREATGEALPLFAGPFDVLIETSTPEDDIFVAFSNEETSQELKGWNGGGYKKIAHASSGQSLRFPRGWLYTWFLRGRTDISGTIAHPLYVQEEFYVTTTHAGAMPRRAVCFRSHFSDSDTCDYFGMDQVPIVRRRLLTFDEFQTEARRRADTANLHSRNVKLQDWQSLSADEKTIVATMEAIAYNVCNDHRFFQYLNRPGNLGDSLV